MTGAAVRRSTTLRTRRGEAGDLQASQAAEILGISERHACGSSPPTVSAARALERAGAVRTTRVPSEPTSPQRGALPPPATRERITPASRAGQRGPGREQLDRPPDRRGPASQSPPAPASTVSGVSGGPARGCCSRSTAATTPVLEQRGPRFALLLAVDDATGAAVHALFRPVEDAARLLPVAEEIVEVRHPARPVQRPPTASSKPPPTDGAA